MYRSLTWMAESIFIYVAQEVCRNCDDVQRNYFDRTAQTTLEKKME